jgi:hypothetical protein
MTTISFTTRGCTHVLDATIAEARQTYALERLDYHDYFDGVPVPRLQRLLRESLRSIDDVAARRDKIETLLSAQRRSPHRLWELLLLQAFEKALVKRRRCIAAGPNAELDALIVKTFTKALENIPFSFDGPELHAYVLRRSLLALTAALSAAATARTEAARRQSTARSARARRSHLILVPSAPAKKAGDR